MLLNFLGWQILAPFFTHENKSADTKQFVQTLFANTKSLYDQKVEEELSAWMKNNGYQVKKIDQWKKNWSIKLRKKGHVLFFRTKSNQNRTDQISSLYTRHQPFLSILEKLKINLTSYCRKFVFQLFFLKCKTDLILRSELRKKLLYFSDWKFY